MNKINFYLRQPFKSLSIASSQFHHIRLKSTNKQNEDDKSVLSSEKKEKNKQAVEKLNQLLQQIVVSETISNTSKLELAKPIPKRLKKDVQTSKERKEESVEKHAVGKDVIISVKNVAESLGGNIKQTESELLSKLLNLVDKTTENKTPPTNLSDIVKGMKIDRDTKASVSRAQQVRSILETSKSKTDRRGSDESRPKFSKRRPRDSQQIDSHSVKERINLFGKDGLGIFSCGSEYTEGEPNKTWQRLYERDLKLAITHPPSNYFQQMILWTEQGKLWKFPIDNEQGMEEEQNVEFTEHVFLDRHLESWCPPKGPIRHFMELVCVGLSKNPYMTVKQKQEHIAWYKDYFEDKQKILEEVGAIPADFKPKVETST